MAVNPYDSQSIVGYNSSPPSDDGSQTAANLVSWQKHVDKLGDPLKTLVEAINAEALASFGELVITTDAGEEQTIVAYQYLAFV